MTCDEARAAFSDLYDGALSGAPLAALDRHLEGCPACRLEWTAFREAIEAVKALGSAEPSAGFAARVIQQVAAPPWWRRAVQTIFFPIRVKVPIQALALVVVAFTAVMVFQRSPELKREAQMASAPPTRTAPRAEPAPAEKGELLFPKEKSPATGSRAPDGPEGKDKARGTAPVMVPLSGPEDRLKAEVDRDGAAEGREDAGPGQKNSGQLLRDEARPLGKTAPAPERGRAEERMPDSASREGGSIQKKQDVSAAPAAPAAPAVPQPSAGLAQPAPPPAASVAPPPSQTQVLRRKQDAAAAKEAQMATAPAATADELYSAGLTQYARQAYDQAVVSFRTFVGRHPRDARVPDARFWLAESYFAQAQYAEAIPEYETVVRDHPGSRRVPSALFRQGQARLALGDRTGCQLLRDAIGRFPQAREAAQAREALAARCP